MAFLSMRIGNAPFLVSLGLVALSGQFLSCEGRPQFAGDIPGVHCLGASGSSPGQRDIGRLDTSSLYGRSSWSCVRQEMRRGLIAST